MHAFLYVYMSEKMSKLTLLIPCGKFYSDYVIAFGPVELF